MLHNDSQSGKGLLMAAGMKMDAESVSREIAKATLESDVL
jgi:hypothetical protein